MADIIHLPARRLQALYALLTGAARPELPTLHRMPDALIKDVGLPECDRAERVTGPLGTFSTNPFRR